MKVALITGGSSGMGEASAIVNRKLQAALEAKLIPIVCIGEL